MSKADRDARLQHVKALGRVAYRFLRASEIEGTLNFDGEEKHLRKFEDDGLHLERCSHFGQTLSRRNILRSKSAKAAGGFSPSGGTAPITSRLSCTSQATGNRRCSIGRNPFRSINCDRLS
jgi:hypothetical protein